LFLKDYPDLLRCPGRAEEAIFIGGQAGTKVDALLVVAYILAERVA
jgi:hypothetical protein